MTGFNPFNMFINAVDAIILHTRRIRHFQNRCRVGGERHTLLPGDKVEGSFGDYAESVDSLNVSFSRVKKSGLTVNGSSL